MRDKVKLMMQTGIPIFLVVISVTATLAGKVIYVDDSANGANDGKSWTDAYNYLQDALVDANMATKPVEIRVAQGIYKPDQGAGITRGDRIAVFQLINGVTIQGGFAGVGVADPDARYIETYRTILSGDLAGDDAEVDNPDELSGHPTRAENSYTIVNSSGTDETAVLDGVTITAAYQWDMDNISANPVVNNCTLTNAHLGISIRDSNQIISNCTFKGLLFQAIDQIGGSLTVNNCLFTDNTVGVIDSHSAAGLTLRDCTFIDNEVRWAAMITCSLVENLRMYNCTLMNNVANGVVGISARVDGEFIAENCTFTGNIGLPIEHYAGRTIVSNCLFAGNKEGFFSSGINSWNKYVTVQNCTFSGNSSLNDGSALNLLDGGKVSNCIFWGNNQPAIEGREQDLFVMYCNIEKGWPGEGNIEVDPCFVSQGYWDRNGTPEDANDDFWVDGDYHLKSQAGRWNPVSEDWVIDNVTSQCIDAGDPNSPIGIEPFPNGGRVNMGAYGSCDYASKSYFGEPVSEVIIAGDINGDGIVDDEDLAILNSHWMMQDDDFINKLPIVQILEPNDGDRIAWPGPTIFRADANDPDGQVDDVVFWIKHQTDGGYTSYGLSADNETNGWEREYTWKDELPSGTWTVWAKATDDEGQVSSSPEITITLYRP